MRYLRKYLQQVGLVSTLLIAGVLGGLMVPLPSEAQTVPTVQFKVDSTPYNLTLTPITCPTGYRLCYTLPVSTTTPYTGTNAAGTARTYTIRNSPNTTARLLVKDINGRDELILTGVQFVPAVTDWGVAANGRACLGTETCTATILGEFHDLRVIITHTFDGVPNPVGSILCTVGTETTCNPYLFALGIGGYFVRAPGSTATTAGNFIKWTGKGTFRADIGEVNLLGVAPRTVNLTELQFQQSDRATSTASTTFSLAQTGTVNDVVATGYPQYLCSNNLTPPTCTPTVILTMAARMYGPDTLATTNSHETIGGSCKVGNNEGDGDPLGLGILDSNLPKIIKIVLFKLNWLLGSLDKDKDEVCPRTDQFQKFFTVRDFLNTLTGTLVGAVPGTQCLEGECVSSDPDVSGTGTITITKHTDFATTDSFTFNIYIGEDESMVTSVPMAGTMIGTVIVTLAPGTYAVSETEPYGWYLDYEECDGETSPSSVTVTAGGNITCHFHNIAEVIY